jgi:hypothetical protein
MPAQPTLIAGVVRDSRGRPVAQARVYFTAGPGPIPDIAALTDDAGAFCLSVPQEGNYTLATSADGFCPSEVAVLARRGVKTTVEVTIKK